MFILSQGYSSIIQPTRLEIIPVFSEDKNVSEIAHCDIYNIFSENDKVFLGSYPNLLDATCAIEGIFDAIKKNECYTMPD